MMTSSPADVVAQVHASIVEALDRDEWCLLRWGRRWDACSTTERLEADRLRRTSLGGGYRP